MQTLFDLMLADVVFACNLIFGWIFIIIINLPTSPEFSQPFAIVLSGKTLLLRKSVKTGHHVVGKFDLLHYNNKLVGWSFLSIIIVCNRKSPIMKPITKMKVENMSEL